MILQKRKPFSSGVKESEERCWPLYTASPLSPTVDSKAFQSLSCLLSRRSCDTINHMEIKNRVTFFPPPKKRRERGQKKRKKEKKRKVSSRRKRHLTTFYSSYWKLFLPHGIYLWGLLYGASSWLRSSSPLIFFISMKVFWADMLTVLCSGLSFQDCGASSLGKQRGGRGWRGSRGRGIRCRP